MIKQVWTLFKETFSSWRQDNSPLLAAGLAYFTVFSLAPLLIIAIAICGVFLGDEAASGQVFAQLQGFVGPQVAATIQTLIKNAQQSGVGFATAFSGLMLLLGASGLFRNLQTALNMIWDAKPRGGFKGAVLNRLITFGMVLTVAVLMLGFFIVNAALGTVRNTLGHLFPILDYVPLWKAANFVLSFGVLTVFLAMIYKFLPAARIAWKHVWIGSAVTSFLLSIGTTVIGLYFSYSNFGSIYGVAASVVIVFVWVYFSAQIFLLGAEFTWVYAQRHGTQANSAK